MSAPKYSYAALPASGGFRTLELLGGQPQEPLCGILHTHTNVGETYYEAISYVWGDGTPSHSIEVDGKRLAITANLHAVLRRLRNTDKSRHVWADGICINQQDNGEKAKQVSRMGSYYQLAARVVVYMGECEDGSQHIPSLLDAIEKASTRPLELSLEALILGGGGSSRSGASDPHDMDMLSMMGLPPAHHTCWVALSRLFLRPWWNRYWIIQEIVMATKADIVCGSWSVSWERFATSMRALDDLGIPWVPAGGRDGIRTMHRVFTAQRNFVNLVVLRESAVTRSQASSSAAAPPTPTWCLVDVVEKCRTASATDPRDYIYAALGMSMEHAGLRPVGDLQRVTLPDYDEDTAKVFTRYAGYMVTWGHGIKLLYSACIGRDATRSTLDIPSWVPDWSVREVGWRSLAPRDDGAANYDYKAASALRPSIRLSTVSDFLIVRGYVVGTIADVGAVAPTLGDDAGDETFSRDFSAVATAFDDLVRFSDLQHEEHVSGVGGAESHERIWRTLCCDIDNVTSAAPLAGSIVETSFLRFRAAHERFLQNDIGIGELVREVKDFLMRAAPFCLGRRSAVLSGNENRSKKRLLAQVPAMAQTGDMIFVPFGSAVPLVLREDLDGYKLVGECFVDGCMRGELCLPGDVGNTAMVEEITIS